MMIKKIKETYEQFWKEYQTKNLQNFSVKLGILKDPSKRSCFVKLLRFTTSNHKTIATLADYIERMKPKKENIFLVAGASRAEVENSAFVEHLLSEGYEMLCVYEKVDEYCISALPELDIEKPAKAKLNESKVSKSKFDSLKTSYRPLIQWLKEVALRNQILDAKISAHLNNSPCELVANIRDWTIEDDVARLAITCNHRDFIDPHCKCSCNRKHTLEINPYHPLISELLRRVKADEADAIANEIASILFCTAILRSSFMLPETADFSAAIEKILHQTLGVSLDCKQVQIVEAATETESVDTTLAAAACSQSVSESSLVP